MHYSTFVATLAAIVSLATAIPVLAKSSTAPSTYYGVSVNADVSSGLDTQKVTEPIPIQLNTLTTCHGSTSEGCSVSQLSLDANVHPNVDINAVECRAYKDFAGTQPGSAPFNVSRPAYISTNLATISSILCYIVEAN